MQKFELKTEKEIEIMKIGGQKLAVIRDTLADCVKPGMTALQIDKLADDLINKSGGKASFKMVPGYRHATCININEEVVHAIPTERLILKNDVVGIDVGLYYEGFHTDTAITVRASSGPHILNPRIDKFLNAGKKAVRDAIKMVKAGNKISDLSAAMQKAIETPGYSVVRVLTGHGVGRNLHEEPAIPCFVSGSLESNRKLETGMVLAIEIMYNEGSGEIVYKNSDGWTLISADGKISGLFEDTVAITARGPVVLTQTSR